MKNRNEQLGKAVREMVPEKADEVLKRYEAVQEGLNSALSDKREAAKEAEARLAEMEGKILEASRMSGETDKARLVDDLHRELGVMADELGVSEKMQAIDREALAKEAKYYFGQVGVHLHDNGLNLKTERFEKEFVKTGGSKKDLESMLASFKSHLPYGHETSKEAKAVIKASEADFKKILLLFVNGNSRGAMRMLNAVRLKIEAVAELEKDYYEKMKAAKETMKDEQSEHLKAVAELDRVYKSGEFANPKSLAAAILNFNTSYHEMLKAAQPLMDLVEEYVDGQEERSAAAERYLSRMLGIKTAKFTPEAIYREIPNLSLQKWDKGRRKELAGVHFKAEVVKSTIPATISGYRELLEKAQRAENLSASKMYELTGDVQYKDGFDSARSQMIEGVESESLASLDAVAEADWNKVDPVLLKGMKDTLSSSLRLFSEVQETAVINPYKALNLNNALISYLQESLDSTQMLIAKGQSPLLFAFYEQEVAKYVDEAQNKALELVREDRLFLGLGEEMQNVGKGIETFQQTLENIRPKDDESFLHPKWAAMINAEASKFRASGAFAKVVSSSARLEEHLDRLRELDTGSVPGLTKEIDGLEKMLESRRTLIAKTSQLLNALENIEGGKVGWEGVFADFKELAKLAFAIAATVYATPAGLGMLSTMAAVSTASTLSYAMADSLVELRTDAWRPQALARSWATTFVLGTGASIVGPWLGRALANKFFNPTHARLAAIDLGVASNAASRQWLGFWQGVGRRGVERSAERALASSAVGMAPAESNLLAELGEEFLQEGLQAIGAVVAPKNELVGFAFMLLGSVHRTAAEIAPNGAVAFDSDITGQIDSGGLDLEFTPGSEVGVVDLLTRVGASTEMIAEFKKNGSLEMEQEGFVIKVKPTAEPAAIRIARTTRAGRDAMDIAGLEHVEKPAVVLDDGFVLERAKSEYTYEGNPETLIPILKRDYFVELNADGDIVATDVNGESFTVVFKNKHVGVEIASMRHNGIEFDAEGAPFVRRREGVASVLAELQRKGFDIEESPEGILVSKEGVDPVEIKMDKEMVKEMSNEVEDGLKSFEELLLDVGLGGVTIREILTKLDGLSSPVRKLVYITSLAVGVKLQMLINDLGIDPAAVAERRMNADLGLEAADVQVQSASMGLIVGIGAVLTLGGIVWVKTSDWRRNNREEKREIARDKRDADYQAEMRELQRRSTLAAEGKPVPALKLSASTELDASSEQKLEMRPVPETVYEETRTADEIWSQYETGKWGLSPDQIAQFKKFADRTKRAFALMTFKSLDSARKTFDSAMEAYLLDVAIKNAPDLLDAQSNAVKERAISDLLKKRREIRARANEANREEFAVVESGRAKSTVAEVLKEMDEQLAAQGYTKEEIKQIKAAFKDLAGKLQNREFGKMNKKTLFGQYYELASLDFRIKVLEAKIESGEKVRTNHKDTKVEDLPVAVRLKLGMLDQDHAESSRLQTRRRALNKEVEALKDKLKNVKGPDGKVKKGLAWALSHWKGIGGAATAAVIAAWLMSGEDKEEEKKTNTSGITGVTEKTRMEDDVDTSKTTIERSEIGGNGESLEANRVVIQAVLDKIDTPEFNRIEAVDKLITCDIPRETAEKIVDGDKEALEELKKKGFKVKETGEVDVESDLDVDVDSEEETAEESPENGKSKKMEEYLDALINGRDGAEFKKALEEMGVDGDLLNQLESLTVSGEDWPGTMIKKFQSEYDIDLYKINAKITEL